MTEQEQCDHFIRCELERDHEGDCQAARAAGAEPAISNETLKRVIVKQRADLRQFMEREAAWQALLAEIKAALVDYFHGRTISLVFGMKLDLLLRSGSQPIPERCPDTRCDICRATETKLLSCGDHWHYFCQRCADLVARCPRDFPWKCETCGTQYPEYVNGCPHCWEAGIRSGVVAQPIPEPPNEKCSSESPHAAHTYGGRPMKLCKGVPPTDCDGKCTLATGQCLMCKAYHSESTGPQPISEVKK